MPSVCFVLSETPDWAATSSLLPESPRGVGSLDDSASGGVVVAEDVAARGAGECFDVERDRGDRECFDVERDRGDRDELGVNGSASKSKSDSSAPNPEVRVAS